VFSDFGKLKIFEIIFSFSSLMTSSLETSR